MRFPVFSSSLRLSCALVSSPLVPSRLLSFRLVSSRPVKESKKVSTKWTGTCCFVFAADWLSERARHSPASSQPDSLHTKRGICAAELRHERDTLVFDFCFSFSLLPAACCLLSAACCQPINKPLGWRLRRMSSAPVLFARSPHSNDMINWMQDSCCCCSSHCQGAREISCLRQTIGTGSHLSECLPCLASYSPIACA